MRFMVTIKTQETCGECHRDIEDADMVDWDSALHDAIEEYCRDFNNYVEGSTVVTGC